MSEHDLAAIEAALSELPSQCRYHGDEMEAPPGYSREACCDAGRPALRRIRAEAALSHLRGGGRTAAPLDADALAYHALDCCALSEPAPSQRYACTRADGHRGLHVAADRTTRSVFLSWED